ncbi:methane monooxygenase/ammonia monooxygenase subunit A [Bradyrhizobium sp. BR 1432]|uniref:methane monooxygenase/ammonia monooxygenase subunit A n=1 Tax=Bradyrhizobium sp. BR 1432 TaxID=3447966 RepID=UPI003EE53D6A
MAITFPAALQYVFWTKFRLPIAATFAVVCLLFGQWINRYFGFHLWSYFPMSEVIPALLMPGALSPRCRSFADRELFVHGDVRRLCIRTAFLPG